MKKVLELFSAACKAGWIPGRDCALDEMMVMCMSRFAGIKVRMPLKTVRDGLKIFVLRESQYVYTFTFQVYTGVVNVPEAGRASLGATAEMVIHLVRQLPATGYIIYTDNYFTMS